jgi:hypothetical protein
MRTLWKRGMLLVCQLLLLSTLLVWIWLLCQYPDSTLIIIPAVISYLGLLVYQASCIPKGLRRWIAFHQVFRSGFRFVLVFGVQRFFRFAVSIENEMGGSSLLESVIQGFMWFSSWFIALGLVLLVVLNYKEIHTGKRREILRSNIDRRIEVHIPWNRDIPLNETCRRKHCCSRHHSRRRTND